MSFGLLALVALQVAAPAATPSADDIVVTGMRLGRVQYAMSVHRLTGATKCRITRSSGDPAVDREMCDIARHCAATVRRTRPAIEACTEAGKQRFLATYVPRRD